MANRALESTILHGQKGQEIDYFKKRDGDLNDHLNHGVIFIIRFSPQVRRLLTCTPR